jgi:hypothetical protein
VQRLDAEMQAAGFDNRRFPMIYTRPQHGRGQIARFGPGTAPISCDCR